MPGRLTGVDALRVAGIAGVVAGHVWGDVDWVRTGIYAWHVPLFFVLTGYFWSRGRDLRTELEKRAVSLAWPYWAWLVIIGVPFVVYVWQRQDASPVRTARGIVVGTDLGRPFSAYWFVAALFFSALLLRLAERLPRMVVWALALVAVAATYAVDEALVEVPLSIGLAVPCVVFVLVGQEYRQWEARWNRVASVLTLALGAGIAAAAGPVDLKSADFGTPVLSALAAVLICVGAIGTVRGLDLGVRVNAWVTQLAASGLVVVLLHAALLYVTDSRLDWPQVASFLVALIGSWVVALAVLPVPVLSGRPRAD